MEQFKIIPSKKKISAEIKMLGSKSYTNRALIMAALAEGVTILTGISESDDSVAMLNALRTLGVDILQDKDQITIIGNGGKFNTFNGTINVGAAGTTMRFLISLASIIPGEIILDGSERMRQRPIHELVNALRKLGVSIEYMGLEGCPPVRIKGGNIKVAEVSMDGSYSSQYFTSLLLIGALLENGIKINVIGEQVSKSYIDMTIDGLKVFGVDVINDNYKSYVINKGSFYKSATYHIEGDCSGAAYLWGIAALNGGRVKVTNINPNSAQGDVKFPVILEKMGCKVNMSRGLIAEGVSEADSAEASHEQDFIEVIGPKELSPINEDIDMELMPDTAQPLAILGANTKGKFMITGLSTLRIKETDRIQAMHDELKKCGIETKMGPDWLEIIGGNLHGSEINTYQDHRMAMSFALAGSKTEGIIINEPNVVSKSFPEFWDIIKKLGVKVEKI